MPFRVQEICHRNGIYFANNAISKNLMTVNRAELQNGNAFICGVSGSGKSLLAKQEAISLYLSDPNADILIIDPEREYGKICDALGGEAITVSVASPHHTPSIVFIDELDKMVGDATNYRTSYNIANTRKVLQVINEHKDHGILTVATVNDTEMLCDALKRSGRFDRILSIGLPDQKERQMIAAFYLKGKKVAHGVSISMISKMTSGMSGADIECIINEAGIHAVLDGSKEIRQSDIVFALDRKVFKAVSRAL